MKLIKVLSGVAAAAVATSALAVASSAMYKAYDSTTSYVSANNNSNFGIFPMCTGEGDAPKSTLAADYGFELDEIGGLTITVTVPEVDSLGNTDNQEYWEGELGGGVVTSLHSDTDKGTYNWPSQGTFWGVVDEDLEIATLDTEQNTYAFEKVGDYTYKMTAMFNFDEALTAIEGNLVQYRIFVQVWDQGFAEYQVTECSLLNDAGEALVVMDGQGNVKSSLNGKQDNADSSEGGSSDNSGSDTGAGDVNGETDGGKDSPDTGIEDVAVVAGLAIVAAGAVVLSKKRK